MNFNYDLATWIDYFIGAFICCFGLFMIEKILINKSFKDIKKIRLLLLIPFTIFIIFNTLAFDNILIIFGTLIVLFLIFKYILEERGNKTFVYSIVCYILILLGEILFALVISLFDYLFHFSIAESVNKAIYSNFVIAVIFCSITFVTRKKILYYIDKIGKSNVFLTIIQFILTLVIVFSSLNYLYIEKWKLSYKFGLILIIVFCTSAITFSFFKQFLKNKEVVEKYKMSEEYLKTSASLIEKYSGMLHKNKNNLIIIKGYIKSNVGETSKYIDSLLDKMEDKKYSWVKKTNHIPIDTIRYVIYYKLSKAEESNLKIFVNVSREIEKIDSKILNSNELGHILDILGEYFDNAIYASQESIEKKLNFDLYQENNRLVFNISNTYKGEIDLNLITKNGYTTKGKGHGFGLYDIDKTIKNINILSNKYEILDNFFVTTLSVNLENNKKSIN